MKIFCLFICCLFLQCFVNAQEPKIYDCFMFSHELDILEIRLNELYPYVDKFVLVEWDRAHRKFQKKPLYFELNKERFLKFSDKIIHIKIEEDYLPNTGNEVEDSWLRENWQRNQIMRGLTEAQEDDVIIISDVDEMYPGEEIAKIVLPQLTIFKRLLLIQKMYQIFLNRVNPHITVWPGTGIIYYKDLLNHCPQEVRNWARGLTIAGLEMGWHFSSMGDLEILNKKIDYLVEGSDLRHTSATRRAHADRCQLVPIDASYPKFIQENMQYLIDKGLIDF